MIRSKYEVFCSTEESNDRYHETTWSITEAIAAYRLCINACERAGVKYSVELMDSYTGELYAWTSSED